MGSVFLGNEYFRKLILEYFVDKKILEYFFFERIILEY